jgi:hypothetical protein
MHRGNLGRRHRRYKQAGHTTATAQQQDFLTSPLAPNGPSTPAPALLAAEQAPQRALPPEVRPGQFDNLVAAAAHNGFQHVEREAFGHLGGDPGWHRQLHAVDDGVD